MSFGGLRLLALCCSLGGARFDIGSLLSLRRFHGLFDRSLGCRFLSVKSRSLKLRGFGVSLRLIFFGVARLASLARMLLRKKAMSSLEDLVSLIETDVDRIH